MSAAQTGRSEGGKRQMDLPFVPGAVAGLVAFLAGYAVTFVVQSGQTTNALTGLTSQLSQVGVSLPSDWQVVGWFFFQMHNVGTTLSTNLGGGQTLSAKGSVAAWLLVVPPLSLLVAGFLVAYYADAPTPVEGARAGALVTSSYLVLSLVFAFLTTWSFSLSQAGVTVSVSAGPSLVTAFVLAGLFYPLVAGGIGGAIAGVVSR